jgi:hypothetical protein
MAIKLSVLRAGRVLFPRNIFWRSFFVTGLVYARAIVLLGGLGK